MVKAIITGAHPETGEVVTHEVEANAICTVAVKPAENGLATEVNSSIIGAMNGALTESMVEALIGACHEILKNIDPMLAAFILAKGFEKCTREEDADGMAGESGEPERPSEQ